MRKENCCSLTYIFGSGSEQARHTHGYIKYVVPSLWIIRMASIPPAADGAHSEAFRYVYA